MKIPGRRDIPEEEKSIAGKVVSKGGDRVLVRLSKQEKRKGEVRKQGYVGSEQSRGGGD